MFDQHIHEYKSMKDAKEFHTWIENNITKYNKSISEIYGGGTAAFQRVTYKIKNPADMTAFKLRWL